MVTVKLSEPTRPEMEKLAEVKVAAVVFNNVASANHERILREALAAAKTRIRELEAEVADLQDRRQKLEKLRTDSTRRTEELAHEVASMERALAHIMEVLKRSAEAAEKLK